MNELDGAAGAIAHSQRLGDRRFPVFLRSIRLEKPCGLRLCRLGGRRACSRRSPVSLHKDWDTLTYLLC
jgi:hypothetical protein